MNNNKFTANLKKVGLVLTLVLGFIAVSNTAAHAQYGGYGGYGRNGGYGNNGGYRNDVYRVAQQNGYNDGLRKGEEDAREGHNNPTGTSEYKRATNGYSSSLGNKNAYKDAYRQAFLDGFNEAQNNGYYNNGRNGNSDRYGNRNRRRSNTGTNIIRQILLGY